MAKQGDDMQLHCPIVGNPMPTIVWARMHYDSGDEEILPDNTTTLVILIMWVNSWCCIFTED